MYLYFLNGEINTMYFNFMYVSRLRHNVWPREKRSLAETSVRMPGTNWCGGGWRAKNFAHLGAYGPTDKCCR